MSSSFVNLPRRYPGLKPFERSQSGVFHGRKEDALKLANLVLRERLVVLFAKSGIGKTSLLQAGVAPELERQEYVPIFFRADKTDSPILDTFASVLANTELVGGRDTTGERPGIRKSLWEQVKRLEFDVNGFPATPVLVFDQFEEVFTLTHSDQSRHDFLAELADLANETMPEAIRRDMLRRYQEGDPSLDVETMQWWERQPEVRIVLSIRSDFLHLLDQVSPLIPGILRNRYQLQPLSREKARIAIVKPALAEGAYASPVFTFHESALTEMVDFLAGEDVNGLNAKEADDIQSPKKRDEVESVNLQIICQDIEEKIIDGQKTEGFQVEPSFYGQLDGLRASIRNFYDNQLQAFPKAYVERMLQKAVNKVPISEVDKLLSAKPVEELRSMAQCLIEENLVTSGNRRNSVVDDTLLDAFGATPDFLDTLVDKSRLLRKEPRLDDFYYEISHDTLLPAIIESRDTRRQFEQSNKEKADLEARLTEEAQRRQGMEAELRMARQKRALARKVSIVSLAMLLLMIVFVIWITYDYVKSVEEENRDARENVSEEYFDSAIQTYEKTKGNWRRTWVLKNIYGINIGEDIEKVRSLKRLYYVVDDSLVYGDLLFFTNKDYVGALRAYHNAKDTLVNYGQYNLSLSPNPDTGRVGLVDTVYIRDKDILLNQRMQSARQIMINQFKIAQRDFEAFNEARVWNMALGRLRIMEDLLPTHPVDIKSLRTELNLNEEPRQYVEQEIARCIKQLRGRGVVLE